jgi:alpha-galactosidase
MREISQYGVQGHWLDMDMLEIGNANMTLYQQQTHFAFWAALKSPLIIGADLTKLSNESLAVLTNKDIIALNQDPLGESVVYLESLSQEGSWQVWAGNVQGGYTVLLLNEKSYTQALSFSLSDLGLGTPHKIVELWSKKTLKSAVFNGTVQPYQTLVFKIDTA